LALEANALGYQKRIGSVGLGQRPIVGSKVLDEMRMTA
jgi:hypothetical protein